ncbi:hypothetical protein ONZ45_g13601 [Pleurotus djamor]|nr:hypothetical protein ONZ45_g13601 [Pleurotus djamor]
MSVSLGNGLYTHALLGNGPTHPHLPSRNDHPHPCQRLPLLLTNGLEYTYSSASPHCPINPNWLPIPRFALNVLGAVLGGWRGRMFRAMPEKRRRPVMQTEGNSRGTHQRPRIHLPIPVCLHLDPRHRNQSESLFHWRRLEMLETRKVRCPSFVPEIPKGADMNTPSDLRRNPMLTPKIMKSQLLTCCLSPGNLTNGLEYTYSSPSAYTSTLGVVWNLDSPPRGGIVDISMGSPRGGLKLGIPGRYLADFLRSRSENFEFQIRFDILTDNFDIPR